MHDDLHCWVVVVDQCVEALVHQIIQGDSAGNERLEVNLPFLDELDCGRVVAAVRDGAAQVDFLEDDGKGFKERCLVERNVTDGVDPA